MTASAADERLIRLCEDVLAPLVQADGGDMFLVHVTEASVVLHLAGTCSGCPGATLTSRSIIEPAVRALSPHARVTVTTGAKIPAGARRVRPATTGPGGPRTGTARA